MKKICKKIVSILVLMTMLVSVMPIITLAAETTSLNLADSVYVRKDRVVSDSSSVLQLDTTPGNHRVAFLKFDFSSFTGNIERLGNMFLTVYNREVEHSYGLKVYILPDDKESWSSAAYSYQTAYDNGIISGCGDLIYQTTEAMNRYQKICTDDISKAVISHLTSNQSNKIVTFRLEGVYDGGYVLYGSNSDNPPTLSFEVLDDAQYVTKIANEAEVLTNGVVTSDINLSSVSFPSDVDVSWTSSDPSVLADDGKITKPVTDSDVTLTLKVSLKSDETAFATKAFNFRVLAQNGSTIKYYWDFEGENGLSDKIGGATFTTTDKAHATPQLHTESGDTVAKIEWLEEDTAFVLNTSSVFGSSSSVFSETSNDNYIVIEMDFKIDSAGKWTNFILRKDSSKSLLMNQFADGSVDWTKLVFVVDMHKDANGNYNVVTYKKNGDVYTKCFERSATLDMINEFRITSGKAEDSTTNLYMDDLKISVYEDFYSALNKASDAKDVKNIIDTYSAMKIIEIPSEYSAMNDSQKLKISSLLLNKNFASDAQALEMIEACLSGDELIVLSSSDAQGKLDEVKLLIGKDGVSGVTGIIIAASYINNELLDVKYKSISGPIATGSIVTSSKLGLAKTGATDVKVMIWTDIDDKISPVTASTSINCAN